MSGWARLPRAIRVLVVSIGLLLGGATLVVRGVEFATTPIPGSSDFTADYVSARALVAGGDPYDELSHLYETHIPDVPYAINLPEDQRNPHSPVLIVLQVPLSRLPLHAARVVWLAISAGAVIVAMFIMLRAMGMSLGLAAALAAGLLVTPLVQKDLVLAQSNGPSLLLLVLGWSAWRRGSERNAGLALGLLAALRLFPALVFIPLVMDRRRASAAWMAGSAGLTLLSTALLIGPATVLGGLGAAWEHSAAYWHPISGNISLVQRVPNALADLGYAGPMPWGLISGVVLVAAVLAAKGKGADGVWLFLCLCLLGLPLTWEHYLLLTLPLTIHVWRLERHRLIGVLGACCVWVGILSGVDTGSVAYAVGLYLPTVGAALMSAASWGSWMQPPLADRGDQPVRVLVRATQRID